MSGSNFQLPSYISTWVSNRYLKLNRAKNYQSHHLPPNLVPCSRTPQGKAALSSQLFKSHLCFLSPKSHIKYISYSHLFYLQNIFSKSDHSSLLSLQALPPCKPPSRLASADIISISLPSPWLPSAYVQHHRANFSKQKPDHVTPQLDSFLPSPQGFPCTLGIWKPLQLQFFLSKIVITL